VWLGLVGALYVVGRKHDDHTTMMNVLRLLPDILRLLRRLAADGTAAAWGSHPTYAANRLLALSHRRGPRLHPGPGLRGRRGHCCHRPTIRHPRRGARSARQALAGNSGWTSRPQEACRPTLTNVRAGDSQSSNRSEPHAKIRDRPGPDRSRPGPFVRPMPPDNRPRSGSPPPAGRGRMRSTRRGRGRCRRTPRQRSLPG
jgi:hypothetical protein